MVEKMKTIRQQMIPWKIDLWWTCICIEKKKLGSGKTAKQSLYLKFMLVIVSRGFTVRLEMAGIYDGLS